MISSVCSVQVILDPHLISSLLQYAGIRPAALTTLSTPAALVGALQQRAGVAQCWWRSGNPGAQEFSKKIPILDDP